MLEKILNNMQTKELIDVTLFPKKPLPSVSRDELVKLKIPLISKLEQEKLILTDMGFLKEYTRN